jgi:cyanophycinase
LVSDDSAAKDTRSGAVDVASSAHAFIVIHCQMELVSRRFHENSAQDFMKNISTVGPLVIIGGAEDKKGNCAILREFVRLAGGAKSRLVVMTVATQSPLEVGALYRGVFEKLGAKQTQTRDIRQREQASDPAVLDALEKATGVFFTGGDQMRITNLLGGTSADRVLHRRHEEGLILGGTSAGAAMMSGTMIVEGLSEATPRVGNVKTGPGMEFLRGTIIDQHFGQRGRSGRLLSALAQYPHQLGIGIDEDTALVVQGEGFEVIGCGAVTVLDAGEATHNDVLERKEGEHVALCNVKLHVLTAGLGFHLTERMPLVKRRGRS